MEEPSPDAVEEIVEWEGFQFSVEVGPPSGPDDHGSMSLRTPALPKAVLRRSEFLRGLRSSPGATALPVPMATFVSWLHFDVHDASKLDASAYTADALMDMLNVRCVGLLYRML
jgi:hypothetical protein